MQISRFISSEVIKSYSLFSSGMPGCLSACALYPPPYHLSRIPMEKWLRLMSTVSSWPYEYIRNNNLKKIRNKSRTTITGTQCWEKEQKSLSLGQDLKYNLQAAINYVQLEPEVLYTKNLCFQFRSKYINDTSLGLAEHMLCVFLFQKVS